MLVRWKVHGDLLGKDDKEATNHTDHRHPHYMPTGTWRSGDKLQVTSKWSPGGGGGKGWRDGVTVLWVTTCLMVKLLLILPLLQRLNDGLLIPVPLLHHNTVLLILLLLRLFHLNHPVDKSLLFTDSLLLIKVLTPPVLRFAGI
jgi:hypothetical protein